MVLSPVIGFGIGFVMMGVLYSSLRHVRPRAINAVFGKLQIFSAAGMGFMHGTNDAQKTSTGASIPVNDKPTLVFVDAIW